MEPFALADPLLMSGNASTGFILLCRWAPAISQGQLVGVLLLTSLLVNGICGDTGTYMASELAKAPRRPHPRLLEMYAHRLADRVSRTTFYFRLPFHAARPIKQPTQKSKRRE